jgi:hypothetical protein
MRCLGLMKIDRDSPDAACCLTREALEADEHPQDGEADDGEEAVPQRAAHSPDVDL